MMEIYSVVCVKETDADDIVHDTLCVVNNDQLVFQVEDNEPGREYLRKHFWLDEASLKLINSEITNPISTSS